eukprot:TCONS_00047653-protein
MKLRKMKSKEFKTMKKKKTLTKLKKMTPKNHLNLKRRSKLKFTWKKTRMLENANKCKKLRIQKFCKFTFKKECKVCSRFYFKTCTKKQGSPTLSCKKGPLQPRQCARKIVGHGSVVKVVDTKHQAV